MRNLHNKQNDKLPKDTRHTSKVCKRTPRSCTYRYLWTITPTSHEDYKFVINFIDEASNMLFVYFLRTKDEAYVALKQLIADIAPISCDTEIHGDNGEEYKSQAFETVLRDNGIKHTMRAPYSPYQNGKSECSRRSLMEMASCMRSDAIIPKSYWVYAVKHVQCLHNRSYQRRTNSTAYELLTGKNRI